MLGNLLRKEIKELLMERSILIGAIIIPLIIFPLMGALTGLGMGAAIQRTTMAGITIGYADLDKTNLTAELFPKILSEEGITLVKLECFSEQACVEKLAEQDLRFGILVPRGFSENFTQGIPGEIRTIYSIKTIT
ncbi:MAG: hypothetical protein J7K78_02785, partial [Thaumarchaeota archaeon]|nr:hypothetical protein [Nitrososphaerota archaeon]